MEMPIKLIDLKDAINSLEKLAAPKKDKLELAVMLREPIAIDYFNPKDGARAIIAKIILGSAKTIPALIGEIFLEEQRETSSVYEGILRAIAFGKVGSGEISNYLFSKKLIKKDDPSTIQQYLNNLAAFGIIKRIGIFNKKKFAYKHASPIARIYYYADEKYNLSERKMTEKELSAIVDEIMPRIIEDTVREALAEKYGLTETIVEEKDFEIDGYLLKFTKPEIALEVKWKKLGEKEVRQIEEKLEKIEVTTKILFVPDKSKIKTKLKAMDITDL